MAEDIHGIVGASGRAAEVDDGGLRVNPRTAFEQAVLDGRAFAWAGLDENPSAHDTLLGLENNSPTHVLKIHKIYVGSDTASQIQIFKMSGVTIGTTDGAAVVGANLNQASGRVAQATASSDETGQDAQGGGYATLLHRDTVEADVTKEIPVDGAIVLSEDQMIGVDLTTAATAANATFIGWFEPR